MWLQTLAAEFPITLADPTVWLSIGQALLVGGLCLLLGIAVARLVGLLPADAPAGETLGVGLASGLLVVAAWWAAIGSGGRSAFTPVAAGFALAIGLALVRRWRARTEPEEGEEPEADATEGPAAPSPARWRDLAVALVGGTVFVVAVALLYGATMGPSPRDGVQPLAFMDEAYYAVLGADLAATGTESLHSPAGFGAIAGLPEQTWYHWGEAWLGAAVISLFGTPPLAARHFVVLPLMLLAAAALTGTLVRRMTGSSSRGAFIFGFLACLFLAPAPLIAGPPLSSWARGWLVGISTYGLAAVAVMLGLYSLAVLDRRTAAWSLAVFVGCAAALIVPAHLAIAVLALVGIGSVCAVRIAQALLETRRLPVVTPVWRRTFSAAAVALAATVGWGVLTGHGIGTALVSTSALPFNSAWLETVGITAICAGALVAIPVAWSRVRKERSVEADLYLGTMALVVVGTLVWGARLGDFSMAHLFFGGIVVFAIPVAAVAVWSIWVRLRGIGRRGLATAMLVFCFAQFELGLASGIVRLIDTGPNANQPVPLEIVGAVKALPAQARIAYACRPAEEVAFWDPRLIGLYAHTRRHVVPMCFQAETFGLMTGTPVSSGVPNPPFEWAPQRALYPDAGARPSPASVAAFMRAHGIDYIYVDATHPNTLVPDAIPIATSGATQVLRLP